MDKNLVIAGLRMKYGSVRAFAELLGYHESSVSHVVRGTRPSFNIASAIATALDKSVEDVFPGEYTKDLEAQNAEACA